MIPVAFLPLLENADGRIRAIGGIAMDHGERLSLLPVQSSSSRERCRSCGMAQPAAGRVDVDVDDDVVVMKGPDFKGFVVVPRLHVKGLEELSISCRANVLAAVQRAARAVREENPRSTAQIVVVTDLVRSEGHMCIRVLPSVADNSMGSSPRPA